MRKINIHEAKTNLSKLIANGEEVLIARYGEPVARLIPLRQPAAKRIPGSAQGKFTVPAEFFDPLPEEILNAFEPK
jgi:antitoxin (DNA-binding transcriptional repressor) of toxin-antitoxin stability system